jgi:hypothetical protein
MAAVFSCWFLVSQEHRLLEADYEKLAAGMRKDEVRALLGEPFHPSWEWSWTKPLVGPFLTGGKRLDHVTYKEYEGSRGDYFIAKDFMIDVTYDTHDIISAKELWQLGDIPQLSFSKRLSRHMDWWRSRITRR